MPYKRGILKGQLTGPELRRMIKAHNKLVSINIPPKTNRDGLIKLIEDAGYKIDHAKQVLRVDKVVRKKNIKLPPPPTPKTAEEKKQMKIKKDKKKLEDNLKLKMKVEKLKSIKDNKKKSPKDNSPKDNNTMNRMSELIKKLGYEFLPYPAEILNSNKLKKLIKDMDKLEDNLRNAPWSLKNSIMKEINNLKKEIQKENKYLRENPKKLSADERELLKLMKDEN